VYVGLACDRRAIDALKGIKYNASWAVATRAASFDYLWNEVRVKGGAYGAGLQVARTANTRFYSYRDSHIAQTFERFRQTGPWVRNLEMSDAELEGYIVSTVASIDAPVKPSQEIRRQLACFLAKEDQQHYLRDREEVIAFDKAELGRFADVLDAVAAHDARCVFGSPEIIAESAADFQLVQLISE